MVKLDETCFITYLHSNRTFSKREETKVKYVDVVIDTNGMKVEMTSKQGRYGHKRVSTAVFKSVFEPYLIRA